MKKKDINLIYDIPNTNDQKSLSVSKQVATNLSILSSCNKLLKSGLLQLVICRLVTIC